eukprot:COSAG05_NODE_938_length_6518_cov_21.709456_2_plen_371_part_00
MCGPTPRKQNHTRSKPCLQEVCGGGSATGLSCTAEAACIVSKRMSGSVRSEPVSRPSTPRIDVAAILAGAQRNRELCREAMGNARSYRRPKRVPIDVGLRDTLHAIAEPEPEPEPPAANVERARASPSPSEEEEAATSSRVARAAKMRADFLAELDSEEQAWDSEQSDALINFDPLAGLSSGGAGRTGGAPSPPSAERGVKSAGAPSGGRRVEHARVVGAPRSAGSRGRRKQLEEAQAFAARDDISSFVDSCTRPKPPRRPTPVGELGRMEMQDIAEAKDDDEYTEAEMQEIERNQQKLADGFEESNAECDRMLAVASSSSNEIEMLADQITKLSSRISKGAPADAADAVDDGGGRGRAAKSGRKIRRGR